MRERWNFFRCRQRRYACRVRRKEATTSRPLDARPAVPCNASGACANEPRRQQCAVRHASKKLRRVARGHATRVVLMSETAPSEPAAGVRPCATRHAKSVMPLCKPATRPPAASAKRPSRKRGMSNMRSVRASLNSAATRIEPLVQRRDGV